MVGVAGAVLSVLRAAAPSEPSREPSPSLSSLAVATLPGCPLPALGVMSEPTTPVTQDKPRSENVFPPKRCDHICVRPDSRLSLGNSIHLPKLHKVEFYDTNLASVQPRSHARNLETYLKCQPADGIAQAGVSVWRRLKNMHTGI